MNSWDYLNSTGTGLMSSSYVPYLGVVSRTVFGKVKFKDRTES